MLLAHQSYAGVYRGDCTGVAAGVYKITLLAYLNGPNVLQAGGIISLSHLEEKEIKIIPFHNSKKILITL